MIIQSKYGTKYTCFSCGCKFYDLNKEVAQCPRCNADQRDKPKDADDDDFEFEEQREEELSVAEDEKTDDDDYDGYLNNDNEENDPEVERRVPKNIEYYDEESDEGFNNNN